MTAEATCSEIDQAVRRFVAYTLDHMAGIPRPLDLGDFTWYRAQLIGVQRLLLLMSDPRERFIGEAIESIHRIQLLSGPAQGDALRELRDRLPCPGAMA
jgi:hypothetical protein